MGEYFNRMWEIQLYKWQLFVDYWYMPLILIAIVCIITVCKVTSRR